MIISTEPRVHHFIPTTEEFEYVVGRPTTTVDQTPEYRKQNISNAFSFVFPEDHYPFRIEDILVEHVSTKMILSNRIIHDEAEDRMLFTYDVESRTITFKKQMKGSYRVHWVDFSKSNPYQGQWRKIPVAGDPKFVNKVLYQGFAKTHEDADDIPSVLDLSGKFQGGFRCYLEINTIPLYGLAFYSDDMKSFLYRGSSIHEKDTFQFRLYNSLGQESDPYCAKIIIV